MRRALDHPQRNRTLAKLGGLAAAGGVLLAGMLFPVAGGIGYLSNRATDTVDNTSAEVVDGQVPAVSTMVDKDGNPIAWLYDQRRFEVPSDRISNDMKLAIVSIEDRRFTEHRGVDWQGTFRAFLTNTTSGEVQQGASTLDQQYIKNYQLLVLARTDAERRAAVEATPARKLREIRMALALDKDLSKDEILTRYLNIVPLGNGSYGVQDAAQTYFGVDAAALTVPQAALLAGLVQSSSTLNPYTNPEGALERRNTVLDTMITNIPDRAAEFAAAKATPLDVLPTPKTLPRGCIAAGDNGFFCDYAMQYLADSGLTREQIERGGYTIRTTLDPAVQRSTKDALVANASPTLANIAGVMSVIRPGEDDHHVVAMASSRTYGLETSRQETVQPLPFALGGAGAGSVFKIFTTAAAMEKGLGLNAVLDVPGTYVARGMGHSGTPGCPADAYCVGNAGNYPGSMTLTNALAQSPNTAFVKLIQSTGVGPTVDMAVRLGMRSYAKPRTSGFDDRSMADFQKDQNLGSFTLGPTWINPLELSNVAATLASHGRWCPPSPIESVVDRSGNTIPLDEASCEQVIDPGLADSLSNGLSKDDQPGGTSAGAARTVNWTLPMSGKTGTTESSMSSAFLGYTNNLASSVYVFGDSPTPGQICSFPLRSCGSGNLYGGNEPARIWFAAMDPVKDEFGPTALPPVDDKYARGAQAARVPDVTGKSVDEAKATLTDAGFTTIEQSQPSNQPRDTVISMSPAGTAVPGSTVTLNVSDGSIPSLPAARGPGPN